MQAGWAGDRTARRGLRVTKKGTDKDHRSTVQRRNSGRAWEGGGQRWVVVGRSRELDAACTLQQAAQRGLKLRERKTRNDGARNVKVRNAGAADAVDLWQLGLRGGLLYSLLQAAYLLYACK